MLSGVRNGFGLCLCVYLGACFENAVLGPERERGSRINPRWVLVVNDFVLRIRDSRQKLIGCKGDVLICIT